jgi:hypothetical protein
MTLSGKYADASAAIIESAQTGHVGRSLPRGAECGRAVGRISAIAGIRDLLMKINQSGLSGTVHASFDDVATQIRFFYEFQSCKNRVWRNVLLPEFSPDTLADCDEHCSTTRGR